MFHYYLYYILGIVMIPGIILSIWAQTKVYTTFNKYNTEQTNGGRTANVMARHMLDSAGYSDVNIKNVRGELTDNFNPTTNTVSLSDSVYNQTTISAIGVAAHEIGHVFQHKQKYSFIKIRNSLVPIINFASFLMWPLIIVGLLLEVFYYVFLADILIYIGIGVYALNVLFCLITLPVELNASKRAHDMLVASGELDVQEASKVKKVLNAAAWTYIAALLTSILSLLRLVLFIFSIRGRD